MLQAEQTAGSMFGMSPKWVSLGGVHHEFMGSYQNRPNNEQLCFDHRKDVQN